MWLNLFLRESWRRPLLTFHCSNTSCLAAILLPYVVIVLNMQIRNVEVELCKLEKAKYWRQRIGVTARQLVNQWLPLFICGSLPY